MKKLVSKLTAWHGLFTLVVILLLSYPLYAQNFANVPYGQNERKTEKTGEGTLSASTVPTEENTLFVPTESSRYTLGINDVIEVNVLRHPEVSGQYLINNEGKIQYEFVGDVPILGLTKDEVREKVTEFLTKYIVSPEVTIKIIGYNSKVVYVIGEVGNPGKIFMRGDTITVHEALLQAGLPLLSAATRKSVIITPAADGKAKRRPVDVYDLLYNGDLRENLVLKPGDTLYVPATFLAKTMRVLQPVAQPIGTVSSTGRAVTTPF